MFNPKSKKISKILEVMSQHTYTINYTKDKYLYIKYSLNIESCDY